MSRLFDAYNLDIDACGDFYGKFNTAVTCHDGMTATPGILYRGRKKQIQAMEKCCRILKTHGLNSFLKLPEAIRTRICCTLGMDTRQKRTELLSAVLISMFKAYTRQHNIPERLVPWPKETGNGIEWVTCHLTAFAVLC